MVLGQEFPFQNFTPGCYWYCRSAILAGDDLPFDYLGNGPENTGG